MYIFHVQIAGSLTICSPPIINVIFGGFIGFSEYSKSTIDISQVTQVLCDSAVETSFQDAQIKTFTISDRATIKS